MKQIHRLLCLVCVFLGSSVATAQINLNLPGFSFPNLQLPSLPSLPSSLPSLPSLPSIPALPSFAASIAQPSTTTGNKPDYSGRKAIFSLPDNRLELLPQARPPYIEVMQLDQFKTYQANRDQCRKEEDLKKGYSDASKCPKYEWSVPYSLEEASQDAAKDLRAAWQRFEDRYYWRVTASLNNPAGYAAYCWINWGGGVNPNRPQTRVTVGATDLEPSLRNTIPLSEPDPQLNLDSYFPLPQVDNKDFCDGLTLQVLPIMYIPAFCVQFEGVDILCTPDNPKPLWFNLDEALTRVKDAIFKAHTDYLADYQLDVMKALTPASSSQTTGQRLLFALPWRSNLPDDGAFIAPIINADISPTQFIDLGNTASSALGGLEGANAIPYYLQSIYRAPTLDLLALSTSNTVVNNPPGDWRLEEFKRLLAPSNPAYYERVGYVNFFEAWNQMTTTVLPEPTFAKATRPILYWAVGIKINIAPASCPTIICIGGEVTPVPIAPYLLPFVGPQMKWTWASVPEGYDIPRVVGNPLFDYRPLLRTEK